MYLLDTCVLLWLAADEKRLSNKVRERLETMQPRFVSAISALEIAVKHRKHKLKLPQPPAAWFKQMSDAHGLTSIAVDVEIALASANLPALHEDPADRIIIATAKLRGLSIVTPDAMIRRYPGVEIFW